MKHRDRKDPGIIAPDILAPDILSPDILAPDILAMPGHLLRRCQQIGVAIFLDECRIFDLTPLQYSVLAMLARHGPMDQARLGGATALDRTTVIVVVSKLESRLLVTRAPSRQDRRSRTVTLTQEGRRLLDRAQDAVRAVQERILAPLAPEERSRFVAMLARIAEESNGLSRAPHRHP